MVIWKQGTLNVLASSRDPAAAYALLPIVRKLRNRKKIRLFLVAQSQLLTFGKRKF